MLIPPLRDRRSDIPLLAAALVEKYEASYHKKLQGISDRAMQALMAYQWPGNVRELQNLIERGHTDTMLTALRCDEGMDTGPVYLKRPLTLDGTAEEILTRAAALMVEMIVTIVRTEPVPVPQRGDPTLFKRRRPEDGDMSGLDDLGKVYDYIRMLDGEGYPPAFIETDHFRFEFTRAVTNSAEVRADVRIVRKPS